MDASAPAQVTLPTDRSIVITREFAAPLDALFDAWTKAEHVARWWDPRRVPLAECDIDLRPQGTFRFVPAGSGSGGHTFVGTYLEITPPTRLVFQTPSPSGADSIGTLVFEARPEGTRLTVTITCASRADRDALLRLRVDAGTARTLDNLAAHLQVLGTPNEDQQQKGTAS